MLGVAGPRISNLLKRGLSFIRVSWNREKPYIPAAKGRHLHSHDARSLMLNVGMIVGSTRPNRFADIPVQWLVEGASARTDLRLTVLDLRDFRLPFFNEPAPPTYTGGVYSEPAAEA